VKPLDRFARWIATPGWVFSLPGLVLLVLLGLPLFAISWKSIGANFFTDVFAPTALAALRLSLLTSSLSALLAVAAGKPLAYSLVRWKFHGKTDGNPSRPVAKPGSGAGPFGNAGICIGSIVERAWKIGKQSAIMSEFRIQHYAN
jgi:hypothetical protein